MSSIPPFRPLTRSDLRKLWADHPTGPVRHLVLEVERYKRVMKEIDELYRAIHQKWRDEVGGNTMALHRLQKLLVAEHMRTLE